MFSDLVVILFGVVVVILQSEGLRRHRKPGNARTVQARSPSAAGQSGPTVLGADPLDSKSSAKWPCTIYDRMVESRIQSCVYVAAS